MGSYKIFGSKQESLNSDAFLSLVGSLSAIFGNALGRFFWGSLTDKVGFKAPFITLTLLQAATMFSYKALAGSRATFTVGTSSYTACSAPCPLSPRRSRSRSEAGDRFGSSDVYVPRSPTRPIKKKIDSKILNGIV